MEAGKGKIRIIKNGPYMVTGGVKLQEKIITPKGMGYIYEDGRELPQAQTYALCRCGKSKNPPFCDGSHIHTGFNGTETASKEPYEERAQRLEGPAVDLLDDDRCAFARFCHTERGDAWELTLRSDNPECKRLAIQAATECPAGRLTIIDKATGEAIEPEYEPAIEVLQDPDRRVSGGLFVKGGIPIESEDGEPYEVRNRVVLCRCGHSTTKPFCDAMHVVKSFSDQKQGWFSR